MAARAAVNGRGWGIGMSNYRKKLTGLEVRLLPRVGALMFESIREGSALTGAPGQPLDDHDLIESWTVGAPSVTKVRVVSSSKYARQNEDGVRPGGKPYVQRSAVGGRHSVRLTRRGLQRIVDEAARQVTQESVR